ncbi:hypothetical protein ACS0TY_018597 [Phlomoides rotata]
MVDMRNLRSISIAASDEKTAWVQAGATLGQLYHTLALKGKTLAFPAGACPDVGGHFTGGGYDMISRKYALAADHVIDAKLINADGKILDRRSIGENLFWAVRGGGGTSFEIVVEFKVSLVTVPERVTIFNVTRTSETATKLVHQWQHIADKADENLLMRKIGLREKSDSSKWSEKDMEIPLPSRKCRVGVQSVWRGVEHFLGIRNSVGKFMIHYAVLWPSHNETDKHNDWMGRLYSFMARYVAKSPRAAYVNYRDLDIGRNNINGNTSYREASVWGLKYYKNNFRRLVRV